MIDFFQQRRNSAEELGKLALRMLACGIPADLVDGHLAMGESQAIKCVKRFAIRIVQVFDPEYLRTPNAEDVTRLLEMNKARGFPGMLGSACIGVGRIVQRHGMTNSTDKKRVPL